MSETFSASPLSSAIEQSSACPESSSSSSSMIAKKIEQVALSQMDSPIPLPSAFTAERLSPSNNSVEKVAAREIRRRVEHSPIHMILLLHRESERYGSKKQKDLAIPCQHKKEELSLLEEASRAFTQALTSNMNEKDFKNQHAPMLEKLQKVASDLVLNMNEKSWGAPALKSQLELLRDRSHHLGQDLQAGVSNLVELKKEMTEIDDIVKEVIKLHGELLRHMNGQRA